MDSLTKDIHEIIMKETFRARGNSISKRRKRDPTRPAAKWVAPARIGDEIGKAISIFHNPYCLMT